MHERITPCVGVIYTTKVVKAQHGGNHREDTNVALLVVDPLHPVSGTNTDTAYTTQVNKCQLLNRLVCNTFAAIGGYCAWSIVC